MGDLALIRAMQEATTKERKAALLLMNSDNFGSELTDRVISIIICAASFCCVYFTKIHPIIVIIIAGIAGLFIF